MNNPESHDMDNDSQDSYQEDSYELENAKLNPPAGLKHLTCNIEQLRQTMEASNNDPMDAIHNLE